MPIENDVTEISTIAWAAWLLPCCEEGCAWYLQVWRHTCTTCLDYSPAPTLWLCQLCAQLDFGSRISDWSSIQVWTALERYSSPRHEVRGFCLSINDCTQIDLHTHKKRLFRLLNYIPILFHPILFLCSSVNIFLFCAREMFLFCEWLCGYDFCLCWISICASELFCISTTCAFFKGTMKG